MAKNQFEDLTEQQIKFCEAYLDSNHQTNAALQAGYAKSGAHVQASRLLKNDKIQSYLEARRAERREAVNNQLAKEAENAVRVLVDLMNNADSESVRLQATKDIMDRAGFKPTERVEQKTDFDGKITFGFRDPNESSQ